MGLDGVEVEATLSEDLPEGGGATPAARHGRWALAGAGAFSGEVGACSGCAQVRPSIQGAPDGASTGKGLGVVAVPVFSALVVMAMVLAVPIRQGAV
jgi:hypothetical protein